MENVPLNKLTSFPVPEELSFCPSDDCLTWQGEAFGELWGEVFDDECILGRVLLLCTIGATLRRGLIVRPETETNKTLNLILTYNLLCPWLFPFFQV